MTHTKQSVDRRQIRGGLPSTIDLMNDQPPYITRAPGKAPLEQIPPWIFIFHFVCPVTDYQAMVESAMPLAPDTIKKSFPIREIWGNVDNI